MHGKYNKIKYILCEKKEEYKIKFPMSWSYLLNLWALVINFTSNINLVYPPLIVFIKMRTSVFDVL